MVKNYLVGAVRPVIKFWYPGPETVDLDNPAAERHHDLYQEMYAISRASARRFLQGDWEEIKFSAPVLNARMFQIAQWYLIRELWFREPCNILSVTADVMMVQPVSIFDEFQRMMLFNYTDPKCHPDLKCYADGQGHYFNDAVTYFPHSMDKSIWQLGERRMKDWFTHAQADWDCGQLIHNHMFWAQHRSEEVRVRPDLNFSAHVLRSTDPRVIGHHEDWNLGMRFNQARVLHFAGSRGAEGTLAIMQTMAQQFGIDHAV